jgi:hypothetical protein
MARIEPDCTFGWRETVDAGPLQNPIAQFERGKCTSRWHDCCRLTESRARRIAPQPVLLRREPLVMHVTVASDLRRRSLKRRSRDSAIG